MNTPLKIFVSFVIVLLTMSSCAFIFPERTTFTPPIVDESRAVIEGSIAVLEPVDLNGVTQWICIRGHSTGENPVLLIMHGGPGFGMLGWREAFITDELEKHFTVVLWDQRGAGKSFSSKLKKKDMTVQAMIDDTDALIDLLRTRFNKNKIYLMGHSWGSALGFLTFMARPDYHEKVAAYVAAGEAVHWDRRHVISYQWCLEEAKAVQNEKALRELEKLTPFDPTNTKHVNTKTKWLNELGGQVSDPEEWKKLQSMGGKTPEYSPADMYRWMRGLSFSKKTLDPEIAANGYDLFSRFPTSRIPLFFMVGKKDYVTPGALVEEYEKRVNAPLTKIFYFPNAHFSFIVEEQLFTQYMLEIRELVENR